MPDAEERKVAEKAREDEREGKSASTQAGEFVREEMHHVREGKHGARSPQQAIAIGLSKARRAGVKLPPPKRGSARTKRQAARDTKKGRSGSRRVSRTRSRATSGALKREGHSAASHSSLSKQAKSAARRRGSRSRHEAARKAVRTKGTAELKAEARKAARTRARHRRAA
jgi:hypothetical protein